MTKSAKIAFLQSTAKTVEVRFAALAVIATIIPSHAICKILSQIIT